jgi:hypothetical protein
MTPAVAMAFWPPNAPTLFAIAVDSAKRIAGGPRAGGHNDALVSVVFAAASLEAFLGETAYLAAAKSSFRPKPEPPIVSAFAQVMEDAEESRVQIQSKFQLGNLVLTGKTYDKGAAPYQDFSDLIAVRNLLMHGKSNERFLKVDGKPVLLNPTAVIDRLASKNILHEAPPEHQKGFVAIVGEKFMAELFNLRDLGGISHKATENRMMTRWTFLIGTKAVAEWACTAASRMATDLIEKAPVSNWKQLMEDQFRKPFSPPF